MVLYTRHIFGTEETHGLRVAVVDPTIKIIKIYEVDLGTPKIDYWAPILDVPKEVMGDFKEKGLLEEFITNYKQHLREPRVNQELRTLARRAASDDVTLLFLDQSPREIALNVLIDEFREAERGLEVKPINYVLIV